MDKIKLTAPFPYFGGKSKIAGEVWIAFGEVKHYIEPFFGSGAVLLNRPNWHPKMVETVNDKDGFIANVWRSIKLSPGETAEYADNPVNHADLIARRKYLIANESRLLENLCADPEWHDPKIAGYWIWSASCWIGSGLTCPNAIPHLTSYSGVNSAHWDKRPGIAHSGRGVCAALSDDIRAWFDALSNRLRCVRVVCGDWSRVCGGNWQTSFGVCGVFFDPPYGVAAGRVNNLYRHDSLTVATDVQKWALSRGDNPRYRIVIAGYDGEHNELESRGWSVKSWSANGGYGNQSSKNINRKKERLWISPHCLRSEQNLFDFADNNLKNKD